MGKRKKERLQRINLGLENPISQRPRFCLLCGRPVQVVDCRQHIHDCWGIDLKPDEPIPWVPPKEAIIKYSQRQMQKEEEHV
jgi:hypothetical protein